ncbi:MAG: hypothetical protein P8183_22540 [Anaerolineae bacterium]
MPRLSRWYIRLAFIYLLLGFTVGGLLLANKGVPFYPALWGWLPAHIEFLLMGWIAGAAVGSGCGRFFCPASQTANRGAEFSAGLDRSLPAKP